LRRQPAGQFLPQPYEQLAAVFKREGLESEAKKILIAKEEDPARLRQMGFFRRAWHDISKVTICYGYKPLRVLWYAGAIVLLGWMIFCTANSFDLMRPATTLAYVRNADAASRMLPVSYPAFNSPVYSLDVFLPIIDLHQETFWLPHGDSLDRGHYLPAPVRWAWQLFVAILPWYMWTQILVGWLLTSLFIAGLTRVVRS